MERSWNPLKGAKIPSSVPTVNDWKEYVGRALLFRLKPGLSTVSGTAIFVLKEHDDGSKSAKIAGFTSFVQDVSRQPSYNWMMTRQKEASKRAKFPFMVHFVF